MSSKNSKRELCILSMLLLIVHTVSFAQGEDGVIALSPEVGAVIDRQERDQYGLFRSIQGFESASFSRLSNDRYAIHIAFSDHGCPEVQEWTISKRELLDNYINRIKKMNPVLGIEDVEWRNTPVKMTLRNSTVLTGDLKVIEGDSLVLGEVKTGSSFNTAVIDCPPKLHLDDIDRLSIPRKSTFMKNIGWGLAPVGIGLMIGLAGGNDSSGMFRMTAGQKAFCLGILIGGPIIFLGGSLGVLRGIDTDIPWHDRSLSERRAILSAVGNGKYQSRNTIRLLPFTGFSSVPYWGNILVFGARFRLHMSPRSGLELVYGRSAWKTCHSNDSDNRWKTSYLMANIFISTSWRQTVNPFLGWGIGRITSTTENQTNDWKYTSHDLGLNFYGGIELRITPSFSLEGRAVNTWDPGDGHHRSAQLSLIFGSNS